MLVCNIIYSFLLVGGWNLYIALSLSIQNFQSLLCVYGGITHTHTSSPLRFISLFLFLIMSQSLDNATSIPLYISENIATYFPAKQSRTGWNDMITQRLLFLLFLRDLAHFLWFSQEILSGAPAVVVLFWLASVRQIDSTIHQVEYYVHSTYLRLLYHLSPISSWAGRDVVVAASQACIERRTAEKEPGARVWQLDLPL